jgi:hypothetical protein
VDDVETATLIDAVIALAFVVASTRVHLTMVKLSRTQRDARASLVFLAVWTIAIVAAFFSRAVPRLQASSARSRRELRSLGRLFRVLSMLRSTHPMPPFR